MYCALLLTGCSTAQAQEESIAFIGARIIPIAGDEIASGTLVIQDGKITRITRKPKASHSRDLPYIAPGLIDNQVNGYASISFGFAGGKLTVEGVRKATRALWKEGVTTYLPTLTTNSHEILKTNFAVLAQAVREPDIGRSIPGYHLEGRNVRVSSRPSLLSRR